MKRGAGVAAAALAGIAGAALMIGSRPGLRTRRALAMAGLASRSGARVVRHGPTLFTAAGERRQQLRHDLALETAEDITRTLGTMKGVLMKLGQMASYLDEGIAPSFRLTLARLQHSAPPMSAELAAQLVETELGAPPDRVFAQWDPLPIAAASIGQVHRALTHDGRAVAVKLQYPGIAATMTADLDNAALLRRVAGMAFPGLDTGSLIAELRERVIEELDYRLEARNQQLFADHFTDHPTIHVPRVVAELSTARVLTTDLVDAARFDEAATWSQEERDLAAETINRFVFRSLYDLRAFNGDPHPGNYLFHGEGRVSFVDFGLVKHFTNAELQPLVDAARTLVIEHDEERFRAAMVAAGFLQADAPVTTAQVVDHLSQFYETVFDHTPRTITPEYASAMVRRFFDAGSPLAPYSDIPRSYVVLQRINLGLYAVLGALNATADWRGIAEEIWPFVLGPPTTRMGVAEVSWRERRGLVAV
ncbi:MAG: AarF/ABC1/UbiB kinase family protein [Candidatus Dormibacteria bacterium]